MIERGTSGEAGESIIIEGLGVGSSSVQSRGFPFQWSSIRVVVLLSHIKSMLELLQVPVLVPQLRLRLPPEWR